MSLVITKGYLVGRFDYAIFDEILVFINNFGNKFTCVALGTRKINSKNARALLYGNYLEIELFHSETPNKLGKLKKVVAINQIGFENATNLGLITINDVLVVMKKTNFDWYQIYQSVLVRVLSNCDEYQLSVYVYLIFIQKMFKKIKINKCIHFDSISKLSLGFSFENASLVCTNCFNSIPPLEPNELKLFKQIYDNSINIEKDFFNTKFQIDWKKMYLKLNSSFKELTKKINETYK